MKITKKKDNQRAAGLTDLFLANYPGRSSFAEAFRTLRTNIQFSFINSDYRAILVTSAGEEEGKTSTVANLSYTMARAGKSTLMIDADLRKPMLSSLLPGHNHHGLTQLLTGLFSTEVKSGSLKDRGVPDLFRLIGLQKKTGILHLSEGREKIDAFFVQGRLKDLIWLTRPEEKKLASVLVKNEILEKDKLKQALARHRFTGQKLGHVLLSMGFLDEDVLRDIIRGHMMEGLRLALQFREGGFEFRDLAGSELPHTTSFNPFDFHQLYAEVVIGEDDLPFLGGGINSAIMKTEVENLFLLPSGSLPHNPSELLSSDRLSFLLSVLRKRFDLLVIDSPPVLPVSDALLLTPHTDGVIFLARAGRVNRELVKKAVDNLRQAKANLLGLVLNQVDDKGGYHKGYYKYYSKYYGEKEG